MTSEIDWLQLLALIGLFVEVILQLLNLFTLLQGVPYA